MPKTIYEYIDDEVLQKNIMIAFRISRVKNLSLDSTFQHFSSKYKYVVVSLEGEQKTEHIHGVIANPSITTDEVRDYIRELYPDAKGNKCLYTKESMDKKQLLKYTLKEGQFLFSGFRKEFIENMVILSSVKENLNKKIQTNEEELLLGHITYKKFVTNHLEIIVQHNQNLYINHLKAYFFKMRLKSGDVSFVHFAENYFLDYL